MIKISLFCKCAILAQMILSSANARSELPDDLFDKVFGNKQEEKKIIIDALLGDNFLGVVNVTIIGENIQTVRGVDLTNILRSKIREEKMSRYTFVLTDIPPSKLPFKITYFPSELKVTFDIPAQDLKPYNANIFDGLVPYYSRKAVGPASFSFGTNYKLEDVENKNLNQPNSFQAQTDSFMYIKGLTVENQMEYLSTKKNYPWYRQKSKLTYDLPNNMQRFEMVDVYYPIIGYQQAQSLGGLSFYRDFSLNPYRSSGPTSSFEYEVETRSLVRTYVNNNILKTEYLNPGRYSVKDIPLSNGVNKIVIELTDEFGQKKILLFNEAGSLDLLANGESRYSTATGYPSIDTDKSKKYDDENGAFLTGFYQYGLNRNWTSGVYAQGNKNFNLFGSNNIFATNYGNWAFDFAGSSNKNKNCSGEAAQATYQLKILGSSWYNEHTLTSKVEYRSLQFSEVAAGEINRYDILTSLSYSLPLFEKINLSFGGNYQNPKENVATKFGYNASLTSGLFNSSSITFYFSKNHDENKLWTTQLYLFLNIEFGNSSNFASVFVEKESQTKRLTLIHDTGKELNSFKVSSSINDTSIARDGSLDLQYNTSLADIGMREELINSKNGKSGSRTSFRFLSAFTFVKNGNDTGFSISRPVSNSYVIFKPNDSWKGQHFGVQSSNREVDSQTGLFGESIISSLTPYQYRSLQLDPSQLDPGYTLGQESFVVYPHYRSGHLFVVGQTGLLVLKGIIVNKEKVPQTLKVGFWTSLSGKVTPFFTGRGGEFFIEGIESTKGKIQLDDEQFEAKEMNLEFNKKGLIDIGNIELPYQESRL